MEAPEALGLIVAAFKLADNGVVVEMRVDDAINRTERDDINNAHNLRLKVVGFEHLYLFDLKGTWQSLVDQVRAIVKSM
jgi:hypothetical protein